MKACSALAAATALAVTACGPEPAPLEAASPDRLRTPPMLAEAAASAGRSSSDTPPISSADPSVSAPSNPGASPPSSAGATPVADAELVVRCVASAVEQLGWLATTAHQGAFLRTALERVDLPEGCTALADDAHVRGFPIRGGETMSWFAEPPRVRGTKAEVELVFECSGGCAEPSPDSPQPRLSVALTLPHRWYCFGWVHGRQHGTGCDSSLAACESRRRFFEQGSRPTTPCAIQTGAAYCDSQGEKRCFPTPWDCEREAPGGAGRTGRCVKTP